MDIVNGVENILGGIKMTCPNCDGDLTGWKDSICPYCGCNIQEAFEKQVKEFEKGLFGEDHWKGE